ncbi:copper homeostasis protein CutC [Periweissella cryptocerci]|uniref:PF03932 family protein CutC n=1 Tax=Periweissella cryptocerci TaxID=2506420 RepID=A0A4P6YS67_9LACO|nr:copper homeostasis protein CutC [Periweissella cryptocerci]QBO35519.1 copper homeostasis protein CutC [Periweissella cryptocerci]
MTLLKEAVVENFTDIPAAVRNGAYRIELTDNMAVGGTTPSKGIIAEANKYLTEQNVELTVMIRARGGNFVYNDTEVKIMEADIFEAQQLGVDGVAFGAVTADGELDEETMEALIAATGGMNITMHMAFDALNPTSQLSAIDWLADHDVTRILTHGGALDTPIEDNFDRLKEYTEYAAGRLVILPGGGINADNMETVAAALNAKQVHGTKVVSYK